MESNTKNIEDDVRKLSTAGVEKEKELSALSQAQTQVQNINNERINNIQMERAYTDAVDKNNSNILQLTGMALDQQVENQSQQVLNPNTRIILSKYGYGKPKTQTSNTSNKQVTTQGIVINNKTENKTTNNIQIPSTQVSPVVKQDNTGRFKAWLNNEFARQKEQSAIREREFEKRESSLNRSTYKLMDFIKDVGGELSERLDPRKISGAFGNELKALMFLFGLNFLSKNWLTILETIDNIEKWIKGTYEYFIGGEAKDDFGNHKKTFIGDLKKFLGASDDMTLPQAIGNVFMGALEMLIDKIKILFGQRIDAVRSLKFPDVGIEDNPLLKVIKPLGLYLRDVLACLFGGGEGLKLSIASSMERDGDNYNKGKQDYSKGGVNYQDNSGIKDTSYGDATISVGKQKQDWLEEHDLVDNNLANNTVSSIRQGNTINSMLEDVNTKTIHTSGVMAGLENLKESAEKNKGTLVDKDFLRRLANNLGINLGTLEIPIVRYKYVQRNKTEEELAREGASPKAAATGSAINSAIKEGIKNITGVDLGGGSKLVFGPIGGRVMESPITKAGAAYGASSIKRYFTDKKTLELVPQSDPRPGVFIDVNGVDSSGRNIKTKQKFFEFYNITPELMSKIENEVAKKIGVEKLEFGFDDEEVLKRFESLLKRKKIEKIKYSIKNDKSTGWAYKKMQQNLLDKGLESDTDFNKFEIFENWKKNKEEMDRVFEEKHKNNPARITFNNAKNLINSIGDKTSEFLEDHGLTFGSPSERSKNFVRKMIPKYEERLRAKGKDPRFAKYMVAQAGLESGWGEKMSGRNNLGGIKVDPKDKNKGKGNITSTKEFIDGEWKTVEDEFANFNTIEDYIDYSIDFLNRKRYKTFDHEPTAENYLEYTWKKGYATDPDYGDKFYGCLNTVEKSLKEISKEEESQEEIKSNRIPLKTAGIDKIESQAKQEAKNSKWIKGNALIEQLKTNKQSSLNLSTIASNNIETSPLESEEITMDNYTPELTFNQQSNTQLAVNKNESTVIDDLSKKVDKIITHISSQNKIYLELSAKMEYLASIATTTGNTVNINNIPKQKTRSSTNITPWSGQTNIGG